MLAQWEVPRVVGFESWDNSLIDISTRKMFLLTKKKNLGPLLHNAPESMCASNVFAAVGTFWADDAK